MQNSLSGDFRIEVRLRSASKGTRNDPRPTLSPEYCLRILNEDTGDDTSDGSSDDMSLDHSCELFENDIFAEFEWLEQIDGLIFDQRATNPGHHHVGYCDGKLIRREDIRATFRSDMEKPTAETSFLAFDLLDRYGCLKPEYTEHQVKKGSGAWGTELNNGDIFLIETLRIDKQYRRLGLGSRVVRAMLERVSEKTLGYVAVTRPHSLSDEALGEIKCEWGTEKDTFEQVGKEISKQFWRSLGFRRIGSSDWFGLASDPEHPGCHLAAAEDYELPALSSVPLDPDVGYLLKSPPNSNDGDYVRRLEQVFDDVAADDPRWQSADTHGNTILHIAATETKPTSVQWILRRTKDLTQQRNSQGETPLDALLATLENRRTTHRTNFLTADVSDQFAGFSDAAVSCLAFLNVGIQMTDADWQRFKYGCTCGQCISGFLSPRMRFALECQAEIWADFLLEDIDRGDDWVQSNHACLTFLPHWVRENLKTNQPMRKGLMNLCHHTAACLRENKIPTEQNVKTALCNAGEWPPSSREFLQRGGSVSAVATMLFQKAMESDEFTGNPLHLESHEDYIEKLPGCRNDHEFGFVSGRCGYELVSDVEYVPDRTGSL